MSSDLFYVCTEWNLPIRLWDIRVGIRGKTAGYVTLNKTNLWPDKVRDPSYCKGGWWKLENRESSGDRLFVDCNSICVRAANAAERRDIWFARCITREYNYVRSWLRIYLRRWFAHLPSHPCTMQSSWLFEQNEEVRYDSIYMISSFFPCLIYQQIRSGFNNMRYDTEKEPRKINPSK